MRAALKQRHTQRCLKRSHQFGDACAARLHAETSKILGSAGAREYFSGLALSAGADTLDGFATLIRAEHAKWGDIIRQTGMRAE